MKRLSLGKYWWLAALWAAAPAGATLKVGDLAPAFTGKLADGSGEISLSQWKGKKAVFVNIFNTWCGPCHGESPDLVRAFAAFKGKPIEFVSICTPGGSDTAKKAVKFSQQYGFTWPMVFDASGEIAKAYDVKVVPTNFLVGKDGKVLYGIEGSLKAEWLEEIIQAGFEGRQPSALKLEALKIKWEKQSQQAKADAEAAEAKALAAMEGKVWLGVSIQDIGQSDEEGEEGRVQKEVLVQRVVEGGPAEQAGLKVDDIVVSIDGKEVEGAEGFIKTIQSHRAGDALTLEIQRGEERSQIKVIVGKFRPPKRS